MGTINYNTSRYITIGINPDDYNDENYGLNEFIVNDLYNEIKSVLNKYNFYFFHVCIVPGYYEGFSIDIDNNFSVCYDDYNEKREVQKEITQIKKFLIECANNGLVACFPGWCMGYANYKETLQLIKEAIKEMRMEAKYIPTYKNYIAG